MELRIGHLYAKQLNIYGDRGNILALKMRAQWRKISTVVRGISIGEEIDPEYFDLFFIGGGQDKQQQDIADDLRRKKSALQKSIDGGAVILSICGGYQLLGHYYRPHEGPELKGLSLMDAYTVAGNKRMIGNVTIACENGQSLVGFENHSGKTFLGKDARPLGRVISGNGNNGEDHFEGYWQGNLIGTYLHGSLLPKNPWFSDWMLSQSLLRRYGKVDLVPLDDRVEELAHEKAKSLCR